MRLRMAGSARWARRGAPLAVRDLRASSPSNPQQPSAH
jgi:hypothetical protein